MICTQCGRAIQNNARFCMNCGALVLQQGMPVYGYGMQAEPVQPKKKKVWPWVLGISMSLVVVIGVLIAVAFGMLMRSMIKESNINYYAQYYVDAVNDADGFEMAYCMPEPYWDYLAETYDVSRETMEYYLTDYLSGQDLHDIVHSKYAWTVDHTYFSIREMQESSRQCAEEKLAVYGLTASNYKAAWSNNDIYLTMIEIDNSWYTLDAMELTEELCQLAYGENSEFSEAAEEYWNSICEQESLDLHEKVPLPFWNYLSENTQTDMFSIDEEVQQYLKEMENSWNVGKIQNIEFFYNPSDIEWYSDGRYSDLDDYDLMLSEWADIPMQIKITGTEDVATNYTYLTMIRYDDKWYVYDYMYLCDMACREENEEYGFEKQDSFSENIPKINNF